MFQTALGKAPKRYSQAVDENRKTILRHQSSIFRQIYFSFGGDNYCINLLSIVLTSLNSADLTAEIAAVDLNTIYVIKLY